MLASLATLHNWENNNNNNNNNNNKFENHSLGV
jgi:hypothetical protein